MHTVQVTLQSTTPLLFGKPFDPPETPHDNWKIHWQYRLHTTLTATGPCPCIPLTMLDATLRHATYSCTTLPRDILRTMRQSTRGLHEIALSEQWLTIHAVYVPVKGQRNTKPVVKKYFPCFKEWHSYTTITTTHPKELVTLLEWAGEYVGFGMWRPAIGGNNGKFRPVTALVM